MPSLLSRFLGKKKNADPTPLLDGEKYEAVPKTPSPSAPTFSESVQRPKSPFKAKAKEQSERGLGNAIRRKATSDVSPESRVNVKLPMLSLNLPDPKLEEKRLQGLGVVFEGITDGPLRLDDEVLGAKRLTATETLSLVQKTSEVICERALETLGVMRPHWFASPRQQEVQLQLISRFLQTLSASQNNGIATRSTSSPATFESELRYTRDPHDVAAVLRWGLRHLELDGNSFGSSNTVDWYRSFVDSERSGSYPSKAFDDILIPLLPVSHAQLLRTTLDLVSSLAAHSEENGISGNKLSKVLGWWIVSGRNVQALGWREFYTQWEAAARQFEHLFLAYIRAQQAQSRMPKRLAELVKNYPFAKSRREDDGIFLPRSRFSTRSATALFVRITADKSSASSHPHPLRIVEDAFKANAGNESTGEYVALWQNIRKVASKPPTGDESKDKSETEHPETSLNLSNILADETIRLLSLVPAPDGPSGPTSSLFTPSPARRSVSVGDRSSNSPLANGGTREFPKDALSTTKVTGSPSASTRELDMATDWQAFSNAGFRSPSGLSLAASLWDNDTEVSQPTPKKGAGPSKRNLSVKSGSPRRASADSPPPLPSATSVQPGRLTYGVTQVVKLDEAFIDFWADTLLDTIARSWPTFVVCQLKAIPTLRLTENDKPIEWLVIERVLAEPIRPSPAPVKTSAASARAASPTQASPTRSEGSKGRWTATTLAATRKRWSLFSHKHDSAPAVQRGRDAVGRKAAKSAKVGEMGEILREEDEGQPNGVTVNGTKVNGTKEVNGVKDTDLPKKETEEKQDAIPSRPAIHVKGVSKPDGPAITNRKEAIITKDATMTTVGSISVQGGAAGAPKPSDEPEQAVEAITQSPQLAVVADTPYEPQPVIEPDPNEELVAELPHPQEQLAPVPKPALASEEMRVSTLSAVVAEPPTLPNDDRVSQPPDKNGVVPEPQSTEEQVPDAPVSELMDEPQASTLAEAKSSGSVPVITPEHLVEEDPSSAEDHVIATLAVPAKVEAAPSTEETPILLKDAQRSRQPAALEDDTVEQPLPDALPPSTNPESAPPSEAFAMEGAVSEPQHASDGAAVISVEDPPSVELISKQPEAVPASTPGKVPEESAATFTPVKTEEAVAADPEPKPETEVVQSTVEEHGEDEDAEPLDEVQAESEHTQQPDIPETPDAEPVPIDGDESVNTEPDVSSSTKLQSDVPGV